MSHDAPPNARFHALSVSASRAFADSGLHGVDAEVVIALDVSLAMMPLYASGAIQELAESLFALALRFDDDGRVPTWTFGNRPDHTGILTRDNVVGFVPRQVVGGAGSYHAACNYAPLIAAVGRKYFPREYELPMTERQVGGALKRTVRAFPSLIDQRPFPIFVIVITGGDCTDPTLTIRQLQRASHLPVFFQFAGVSPAGIPSQPFTFLERIDRLRDRHVDNCGFFQPQDFREPQTLFAGLLNEFPQYLALPKVKAMLLPPAPTTRSRPVTETAGVPMPDLALETEEEARRERARVAREARRRARVAEAAAGGPAPPPGTDAVRPPRGPAAPATSEAERRIALIRARRAAQRAAALAARRAEDEQDTST